MPMLPNRRVRFWSTERLWRAYGLRVAAEARASSRTFRVIRRKNADEVAPDPLRSYCRAPGGCTLELTV
jgi:hypothetical protein